MINSNKIIESVEFNTSGMEKNLIRHFAVDCAESVKEDMVSFDSLKAIVAARYNAQGYVSDDMLQKQNMKAHTIAMRLNDERENNEIDTPEELCVLGTQIYAAWAAVSSSGRIDKNTARDTAYAAALSKAYHFYDDLFQKAETIDELNKWLDAAVLRYYKAYLPLLEEYKKTWSQVEYAQYLIKGWDAETCSQWLNA